MLHRTIYTEHLIHLTYQTSATCKLANNTYRSVNAWHTNHLIYPEDGGSRHLQNSGKFLQTTERNTPVQR